MTVLHQTRVIRVRVPNVRFLLSHAYLHKPEKAPLLARKEILKPLSLPLPSLVKRNLIHPVLVFIVWGDFVPLASNTVAPVNRLVTYTYTASS